MNERVAFGATCTWWDLESQQAFKYVEVPEGPSFNMPCCPFCNGPLNYAPSLESWFLDHENVGIAEDDSHWEDFIEFLQGKKCKPSIQMSLLRQQYEERN